MRKHAAYMIAAAAFLLCAADACAATKLGDLAWQSDVAAMRDDLAASDRVVFAIVQGTNVLDVVTNYDSQVSIPERYLVQIDTNGSRRVIWRESTMITNEIAKAAAATDAAIAAALTGKADKAWSHHTSGLGQDAPDGVTWISTPETVLAGGYEYEKVVTTAGAAWILTSNGLATGATADSFFKVAATDGTELFSIEKTDSYLVGVDADGITRSGNTVTIPINIAAPQHPYIRATTNLVNAVWTKEDENGISCPWASVNWSGSSGAYVATVTCAQPQAFFYFEYLVEGVAKVKNTATTELSGGIYFNGNKYMPTVSGTKLEFIRQ